MAGLVVGKAFFEVVDAVIFGVGVGEAADTVEVVALETMLSGVFNHVPLDEILGVVFFHVFFIATREKIDNFVAVEEKHGGAEGCRGSFCQQELGFAFFVKEVVHLFVIAEGAVLETAAF